MMGVRVARVDLPKPDDLAEAWISPKHCEWPIPFHFVFEREFRAGKDAYRDRRLFHCGKTPRASSREAFGHQIVANPCRSGSDIMQTIVAHIEHTPLRISAPLPISNSQRTPWFRFAYQRAWRRDLTPLSRNRPMSSSGFCGRLDSINCLAASTCPHIFHSRTPRTQLSAK